MISQRTYLIGKTSLVMRISSEGLNAIIALTALKVLGVLMVVTV
jgi:hypothetical protein